MPEPEFPVSQSELYDTYSAAVYGIILKVCPDKKHAGEILHGVFRKIGLENEHQPTPGCRTFTWILRLLLDQCEITLHRQKSELVAVIFPFIGIQAMGERQRGSKATRQREKQPGKGNSNDRYLCK